ncbi:MAG TPA: isoprenylcysteine carboxylmethyltransferase family protein [Terriglobales bacterium]|nr:isoprenylcysteine carboxylmethyltransferase family protein [Terriglobales bacterium]
MKRTLALVYGVLAYAFFFGTFLYAIGFLGNVGVPKSIDNGSSTAKTVALGIDLVLLGIFAVQHSVMARKGFKQQWTRIVASYVERSTYVVAASAALALLLWQWRPLPGRIWDVRGTALGSVLNVTFWIGWGILLLSTFLVNHFELFGLAQVWTYFRGAQFHSPEFKTPALYNVVRHPIYLGFVVAFWSAPLMTVGHLLFAIATTGYILVGIYFEEKDLIASFGDKYRDYRNRVPMHVPFLKVGSGQSSRGDQGKAIGKTAGR